MEISRDLQVILQIPNPGDDFMLQIPIILHRDDHC